MFKEFKEFAMKGNLVDLAVGVIIGSAFSKIVASFVSDIIMPILGLLVGKVDFSNLFITLGDGSYNTLQEAKDAGAVTVNYGLFVNNLMDFLIVAFSIFIVVKQMNKLLKRDEKAVDKKKCKYCYSDINIKATRCPNCTAELEQN